MARDAGNRVAICAGVPDHGCAEGFCLISRNRKMIHRRRVTLTSAAGSGINNKAAVAATRGDLGQLAPRKKLLKSFSSFPEDFLRPSEHFGAEGFSFLPSLLP